VDANAVGVTPGADLLALARSVERCVPADLDGAQRGLELLGQAIRCDQDRGSQSAGEHVPAADSDRLQGLIARIARDVAGGHVLAVSGLERQVKRYLRTRP
jgi:hypothetical protein